jgi:hypothetical protein
MNHPEQETILEDTPHFGQLETGVHGCQIQVQFWKRSQDNSSLIEEGSCKNC